MNLTHTLLPTYLHWGAHAVYLSLLAVAIYRAPWRRLVEQKMLNVFLGSCVMLLLIWSLKAGVKPGLSFHLLGGTLFMLMFGWPLAIIGISLVLFGATLNGAADWESFSLNALLMGAIPVFVSALVYHVAVRRLPHNFFIYVIVNAYFCGGLAVAMTMLNTSVLLVLLGPYSWSVVTHGYLPFMPFVIFGEGFMTGMLAAGMALMKPHWLITFDERQYIAGK